MLDVRALSLNVGTAEEPRRLLDDLSLRLPSPHFAAVIGPSGCGKSTLLKAVAGIGPHATGSIHWHERALSDDNDFHPAELGYVPQFNITHESLTARECLEHTLRLRVSGLDPAARADRADELLELVGLTAVADTRAKRLSGGQRRRLALGMELVTRPRLLLCDEVTSGLDAKAEDEITALLHDLARSQHCLVLNVTHQTRHLAQHDSVVVLYEGRLAFHGPPSRLGAYFGVDSFEGIYPALAARPAEDWARAWEEHRDAIAPPAQPDAWDDATPTPLPAGPTQFAALLARRLTLFLREPGQLWLQIALLVLFPGVVGLFALDGLPQIRNLSLGNDQNLFEQLKETLRFTIESGKVGSLVSGLVMFQVILLALMGANNAARAVVADRPVFEKEKLGGVRPGAFLAAESVFLAGLVFAQSVWMTAFVKFVVGFPGDLVQQAGLLLGVNAAVTAVCLAISAWSRSTEQASLISVYLVGFQLPLSGAVLALPDGLNLLVRPLIASYWGWSGYLQSLSDTRFYDVARSVSDTDLAPAEVCLWVLASHVVVGGIAALLGCRRSQWE